MQSVHIIIESRRLEKTFRIIEFNHWHNTAKSTTKLCPQVSHLYPHNLASCLHAERHCCSLDWRSIEHALCKSTHLLAQKMHIYRSKATGYAWAIRKINILACHNKIIKGDKVHEKENSSGVERIKERWHPQLVRLPGGYPHPCHHTGCWPLPYVRTSPETTTASLNSFLTYMEQTLHFIAWSPLG